MKTKKREYEKHNRKSFAIAFIVIGIVIIGALKAEFGKKTNTVTDASQVVSFPADHAAHPSFKAEWWYLNILTNSTQTNGSDEQNYANVVSFSRINNTAGLLTSFAQPLSNAFTQKTDISGTITTSITNGLLFVQYKHDKLVLSLRQVPSLSDGRKQYTLTGFTPAGGNFSYVLTERTVPSSGSTTPLLWGCTGQISVFAPNDTFYYSMPDLDVTGSFVTPQGVLRTVKAGKAWFDHQWFNTTPPADWKGHYWTSSHWSTNQNIFDSKSSHEAIGFVTQVYTTGNKYTYWVRRKTDGKNECGTEGAILPRIYSPRNQYPTDWSVTLIKSSTNKFAAFETHAFSDTEVFVPPIGPSFFEATAQMTGTINGRYKFGAGFIETHLKQTFPTR